MQPTYDLAWLLAPTDKRYFLEEIWQRRAAVLTTGRSNHFGDLFSTAEVERIIEFCQPSPPAIRLTSVATKEGMTVPLLPNGRINVDELRKLYRQGRTVILNSVENYAPQVARLARSIETEMMARVQVNCYLTPTGTGGFRAHYDTHDVLVAQIAGSKLWKVYGDEAACPLNELVDGDPRVTGEGARPRQLRLHPGDLMYIPRGWVHAAVTEDDASLHLTFGLHPPLGKDLLSAAIGHLTTLDPRLREALPVGRLDRPERRRLIRERYLELARLLATEALADRAARTIDEQFIRRGRSGGDGHLFTDVDRLGELSTASRLERRPDIPCRIETLEEGKVGLQFLNGLVRGPAALRPAMEFVMQAEAPFAVAELPGLESDHQLAFAASLILHGLCRMVAEGGVLSDPVFREVGVGG